MTALTDFYVPTIPPNEETVMRIDHTMTITGAGLEDTIASLFGAAKPEATTEADFLWSLDGPAILDIGSPTSDATSVTALIPGSARLRLTITDPLGKTHEFQRPFRVMDATTFVFHGLSPTRGVFAQASPAFDRTTQTRTGGTTVTHYPAFIEFRPTSDPPTFVLRASPVDERGGQHADYVSGVTSITWRVTGGSAVQFDDGGSPVPSVSGTLQPTVMVQELGPATVTVTALSILGTEISAECALLILGPTSAEFRT